MAFSACAVPCGFLLYFQNISITPKENLILLLRPRPPLVCCPSLWVGLSETHGHMESHSTRPFASGSFTWHRVFKVPGCGVCWCFVPFYGCIIFRRPDVSHFVFPLVVDGHLGCFSTFRRLRIMLPSVGMSWSLSESLFSVLPGVYLGLELLGPVALL